MPETKTITCRHNLEIYAQETVDLRMEELQALQERERLVGFGQVFFTRAVGCFLQQGESSTPDGDRRFHPQLLTCIAIRMTVIPAWWKTMSQGLPEEPFLPLFLAEAWGIVPLHYNFHLAKAQYDWSRNGPANTRMP